MYMADNHHLTAQSVNSHMLRVTQYSVQI